ncbi:hypothetical protein RhiirA4_463915 [Rhizophagus irregularis]|uniref:Uncharacterized protein n=1 Tax=Rhizophagus irregularis TaxID=588596 RepID=A0A2I1GP00_9GLOM|nr:hypothetical protein RhiirA4_463915 [Rhizophagus irregularis]
MDETPVWFDMAGNFTINPKGEKTVHIRATDRTKLPPICIFKGKRMPRNEQVPPGYKVKKWHSKESSNVSMIHSKVIWKDLQPSQRMAYVCLWISDDDDGNNVDDEDSDDASDNGNDNNTVVSMIVMIAKMLVIE